MPEPTNHDKAALYLQLAEGATAADTNDPDPAVLALIGIGHYLGAIHEALLALSQQRLDPRAQISQDLAASAARAVAEGGLRAHPSPHQRDTESGVLRPVVTPPNPADIGGTTWHGNQMHHFSVPPPPSPSEG